MLTVTVSTPSGELAVTPAGANVQLESVFQDDDLLLHQPPEKVDDAMQELKALGVDRIRVSAIWRERAPLREPSDPSDPDSYNKYDAFKFNTLTVRVPVPEPATWLMMIAGFGLIGGSIRRQRKQQAALAA